jgi:stalled ribosome alternative rescue factor ArfA
VIWKGTPEWKTRDATIKALVRQRLFTMRLPAPKKGYGLTERGRAMSRVFHGIANRAGVTSFERARELL